MNPNSSFITKLLYNFGHYFSIGLMIVFIAWTYIEPNFYTQYVKGEPFLIWTCYILPWVIITANVLWQIQRWK